jgi:hypothetical protein
MDTPHYVRFFLPGRGLRALRFKAASFFGVIF